MNCAHFKVTQALTGTPGKGMWASHNLPGGAAALAPDRAQSHVSTWWRLVSTYPSGLQAAELGFTGLVGDGCPCFSMVSLTSSYTPGGESREA